MTLKYGKIVQVSKSNNVFDYKILTQDYEYQSLIECLFHLGISYYGDSLGYDYSINLVDTPYKILETNS